MVKAYILQSRGQAQDLRILGWSSGQRDKLGVKNLDRGSERCSVHSSDLLLAQQSKVEALSNNGTNTSHDHFCAMSLASSHVIITKGHIRFFGLNV